MYKQKKKLTSITASQASFFKHYIQLSDIIFSPEFTESISNSLDKIKVFFNNEQKINKNLPYFIRCLTYFCNIRPKQRLFYYSFLTEFLSAFPQFRPQVFSITRKCTEISFLYKLFSNEDNEKLEIPKLPPNHQFFTLYEENSFELILKDDNIAQLKKYIESNPKINLDDMQLQLNITISDIRNETKYNLIDFCAYFGSYECIKFLNANMNIKKISEELNPYMCIAGGDMQILHFYEQNGVSFNKCFYESIEYHQYSISDYLLLNYKCERLSYGDLICLGDYRAFVYHVLYIKPTINKVIKRDGYRSTYYETELFNLCTERNVSLDMIKFLLKNGADPNKQLGHDDMYDTFYDNYDRTYTILSYMCHQYYIQRDDTNGIRMDVIKFLIENGASVNAKYKTVNNKDKGVEYETPLLIMCKKECDFDILKLLIDHRADMNMICKNSVTESSPFCEICRNNFITFDILKYFVDNGANVNQTVYCKFLRSTDDPLSFLCCNDSVNLKMVKYLIEHGARIDNRTLSLYKLIDTEKYNIVKYLIKKGANPRLLQKKYQEKLKSLSII